MDTGVWLLDQGVPPEQISWVMPRDSWIVNRVTTQNGPEFFDEAIGGAVRQLRALAEASSVDDLFLRLEAAGQMLRLDPQVMPACATSPPSPRGELAQLRPHPAHHSQRARAGGGCTGAQLRQRHRDDASETLYIDCTASALDVLRTTEPIFSRARSCRNWYVRHW